MAAGKRKQVGGQEKQQRWRGGGGIGNGSRNRSKGNTYSDNAALQEERQQRRLSAKSSSGICRGGDGIVRGSDGNSSSSGNYGRSCSSNSGKVGRGSWARYEEEPTVQPTPAGRDRDHHSRNTKTTPAQLGPVHVRCHRCPLPDGTSRVVLGRTEDGDRAYRDGTRRILSGLYGDRENETQSGIRRSGLVWEDSCVEDYNGPEPRWMPCVGSVSTKLCNTICKNTEAQIGQSRELNITWFLEK